MKKKFAEKFFDIYAIFGAGFILISVLAMPISVFFLTLKSGDLNLMFITFGIMAFYGWFMLLHYWFNLGNKLEEDYKKKYKTKFW